MDFEDYLCDKGDEIDNAAYALAVALLRSDRITPDEDLLPWNMSIIRAIVDAADEILKQNGKETCDPGHIDTVPCYKTDDCKKHPCPFKK